MKQNRMYTHIAIKKDASGDFLNYEIYYKVELEPGLFTTRLIPASSGSPGGDYLIGFSDSATTHVISLIVSRGNGADTVSRDGKIIISGVSKKNPGDPHKIEFRIEDSTGPIGGQGKSTPHYGDAD